MLTRFVWGEEGVTAIEYALIGTLVLVGAISAMDAAGEAIATNLYDIIQGISNII